MQAIIKELQSAQTNYRNIGFDIFPIVPGAKSPPLISYWSKNQLDGVWDNVPQNANIAIRCGGKSHVAVLDCDDKNAWGTYEKTIGYLRGLGFNPESLPIVQTASGIGRHIYFTLDKVVPGNYTTITKEVGAGEFRYGPGAYVLAPPSYVTNCEVYHLLSGDITNPPKIRWQDISPILYDSEVNNSSKYNGPPISRFAKRLLNADMLEIYDSRSEMECALMCSLINKGWGYPGIQELFLKFPCGGKFQEKLAQNRRQAFHYLKLTYDNAKQWTNNNLSEGRQLAEDAIKWALNRAWKGRTGAYDRDIFLAHAQIAYRCGKVIYAASCRELAEIANISHMAATNGSKRLIRYGYIHLAKPAVANLANMYRLNNTFTLPQLKNVRECKASYNHDVFCYQGLGKSSKLIIEQLKNGPRTVKELVGLTGKTKPTVMKWLGRMSRIIDNWTGEIVPMVYEKDGIWFMVDKPDFDYIAQVLGVAGKQEERKRTHRRDRELHARSLRLGLEYCDEI